MKKCFVEAHYGRNTPCHFGCTDVCKRFIARRDRSPVFVPTFLPGLAAWFRYGVGVSAAQWDDVSGNGRHLKQATGDSQPAVQGDGSLLFDGADDFMKCDAFTLNQPATVYLLFKQVTWTLNDFIFGGEATTNGRMFQSATTPDLRMNSGTAGAINAGLAVNTYGVVSLVFSGAASLLQVNNGTAVVANAGTNAMAGFTLGSQADGAAAWSHIQTKEVALYSGAHDAGTRAQVIAYLAGVGNLTL